MCCPSDLHRKWLATNTAATTENTIMLGRRSVLSVTSRQRQPTPGLGIDILGIHGFRRAGRSGVCAAPATFFRTVPNSREGRLQPGQEAGISSPSGR